MTDRRHRPSLFTIRGSRPGALVASASLVSLVVVLVAGAARRADAQEFHDQFEIAGGHALGDPQQREFGFGAMASAAREVRWAKVFGLQLTADIYDMSQGSPPSNPAFAQHGQGFGFDGFAGIHVRPFGRIMPAGLWLAGGGGIGAVANDARAVADARIGWDFALSKPAWDIGPFVGYTEVFQPSDTLRPEDAHLLWVGLHVDISPHHFVPHPDRDGDGVYDDEDACPDVAGVRTGDPKTNGCPPPPETDRDADGILDKDDACPDIPGVHTDDPKTNGCPPAVKDRDRDSILDADDACPDVPGVRTADPKTNGCPLPPDRDKDSVLDDADACPDVPGVRTEDPRTNGCPAASKTVHVEGDEILLNDVIHFETGSPRVRHGSWPLVKQVAQFIQSNDNIDQIDIEGHADDTGTSEYNLYLSKERATSVKNLLVHFGADPNKLVEHAYGESRPRKAGHDREARSENRRVEFTILHAREGTTPAQPLVPSPRAKPQATAPKTPAVATPTTAPAATTTTTPAATTPATTKPPTKGSP